ncbi:Pectinesterase inhibitor [Corchorus capsularis]|uniref:Pectinesterase inhibitor n=1 Tax=Corchorus capsularis TaxID=210143 RepID=A0A1R3ITD1_COCAP|nr:Pectinesterase inhibitor [Corchorus capsularis]
MGALQFSQSLAFSFAILFLTFNIIPTVVSATTTKSSSVTTKTYKKYINKACQSATYPKDCYASLSKYASTIQSDPVKLYKVSLYITIKAARSTSSSISSLWLLKGLSPTDRAIVRDCAENIGNAVDQLKDSLTKMANLEATDREAQMENIRTWVSAALTDEGTCTDEFDGQKVSDAVNKKIKKPVFKLAKLTSNCLALIDPIIKY